MKIKLCVYLLKQALTISLPKITPLLCPLLPLSILTILWLQLGAGLGSHKAGHEAVSILGAGAALRGHGGGADARRWQVSPADDRAGRGGLARGGQVLLLDVYVQRVQTHLGCAAWLTLILHR